MAGEASDRTGARIVGATSNVSLTKFKNVEPVLARGIGRLTFEFTAPPMADDLITPALET